MGLLSAKCFANEGANVVMADFDEKNLEIAVEEVRTVSGSVIGCTVDVRNYDQVSQCCKKAAETFGTIDILIPFAGGAETRILQAKGDFLNVSSEVIDFGIDVNLKGALYFSHAAMNIMKEQKSGVVILIGSITGEEGCDTNVAYSSSKSALMNGTVKSLAKCGGKYGIRVCTVAPGPVLTRPGMAGMKTLMGRAADPQEIVDMVMFLASEKGAFVTGTSFLLDGGRNVLLNKNWD